MIPTQSERFSQSAWRFRTAIAVFCLLVFNQPARSEVVETDLPIATNGPVDLNHDGITDVLIFGFESVNGSAVDEVWNVIGNSNTAVLVNSSSNWVQPLVQGNTVSLTPVPGSSWVSADSNAPIAWSSSTSLLTHQSDVQGVSAPGYGNYMGVLFLINQETNFGWIEFATTVPQGLQFPGPAQFSIVAYAYETTPDTPIIIPVPEPKVSQLLGIGLIATVGYFVQKRRLALH